MIGSADIAPQLRGVSGVAGHLGAPYDYWLNTIFGLSDQAFQGGGGVLYVEGTIVEHIIYLGYSSPRLSPSAFLLFHVFFSLQAAVLMRKDRRKTLADLSFFFLTILNTHPL